MSIELARHRMGWHCSASAVGCGFNAARAHSSWPVLGVRLKKPCPAVLLRDGQGQHAVIKKMGYHWHLRKLMADQQMFQTSDLALLLADRGVVLSREQDARPRVAGHQRPQHRHDRSRGQPASDRHQRPLRSSLGHSPDLGPVRRRQLGRLPCRPPERPIVLASPGVRESHETGDFGASGNGPVRGFAGVLAAIRRPSATQGSPTHGQALTRPSTRCQIMA